MKQPTERPPHVPPAPDLRRLLLAYTVSMFGTLVGSGVVVWVAITSADVTGRELGLLSGSATLAAAITALVLAPRIDGWHKRVVMVGLDAVAAAALVSLSLAAWWDAVTVPHLALVAAVEISVGILFAAASTPMLRHVSGERLDWALGRQESVFWAAQLLGPPVGGVITSSIGASLTLAINGASFVISAALLAGVGDPGPSAVGATRPRVGDGLRTIWSVPELRALYLNAAMFGTALMAMSPVLALFIVRELGLSAWQYGLVLGAPCVGGIVAGWVSHRFIARHGKQRVLLATGILRTVWLLPTAAVMAGPTALASMLALQFGLLFSAGLFNPTFASIRIEVTPPDRLSAVVGSWAATTRLIHPVGIVAVGFLAEALGVRLALVAASALGALSVVPLLAGLRHRTAPPPACGTAEPLRSGGA